MRAQEHTLCVPAKIEYLDEVQDFIDAKLDEAGFSARTRLKIAIAAEEIFVNVAHYAYAPATGDVGVDVRITADGAAEITFSDAGIPYDPLAWEDPDTTLGAEERAIGGLGVFMVKSSMGDVRYAYIDGQNRLTLIKRKDG